VTEGLSTRSEASDSVPVAPAREPPGGDRHYKGYRVYAYIALSRLFGELNLDLEQPDLSGRVGDALRRYEGRVAKEEILHAIRSNSHMTEKVLGYLQSEGFAEIRHDDRGYDIRITPTGAEHLQRYHRLYRELYGRELAEHYRFVRSPEWLG
jgi:predicted transcriptional regulator